MKIVNLLNIKINVLCANLIMSLKMECVLNVKLKQRMAVLIVTLIINLNVNYASLDIK